mmetsp:Transcript_3208/g.3705  ORF Transcript_3208/g.3705 Transcript_3208/m.3705 type:complete len:104 (+) Transcript_3208:162-473(+)
MRCASTCRVRSTAAVAWRRSGHTWVEWATRSPSTPCHPVVTTPIPDVSRKLKKLRQPEAKDEASRELRHSEVKDELLTVIDCEEVDEAAADQPTELEGHRSSR